MACFEFYCDYKHRAKILYSEQNGGNLDHFADYQNCENFLLAANFCQKPAPVGLLAEIFKH